MVYREAYNRLSRSRQWTEAGPQSISVSEMLLYCDGFHWDGLDFRETLIDLVQEMDSVFIDHCAKERKAAAKGASSDVVG